MANKRYAVFIPCYNAATTITETLVSVGEAIDATGLSIPVFIYDDCSTDNSYVVVEGLLPRYPSYRVLRNQQNVGERRTTNAAFSKFAGEFDWVFIIHADDIVKNDWLSTLIREIEPSDDRTCFTVWSSYDTFDESGATEEGDNSGKVQRTVKEQAVIVQYITRISSSWHISGCAVNVPLFQVLKGFDEGMPQFGDTDFFVRGLLAGYTDVYISRTLTRYRILTRSVSGVSYRTNRDVKETYVLIHKFRHLLDKKGISAMHRTIMNICARRTVKWLTKGEWKLAMMNVKQCMQAIGDWINAKFGSPRKEVMG